MLVNYWLLPLAAVTRSHGRQKLSGNSLKFVKQSINAKIATLLSEKREKT
jgi:hypothetical protein